MLRSFALSLKVILTMALALTAPIGPAHAEPLDYIQILEVAERYPLTFDTEYEHQYRRQLPIHFKIAVPQAEDLISVRASYKAPGNVAAYAFLSPEGQLAEYITITSATLPEGPRAAQIDSLSALILDEIVPSFAWPELKNLGARPVTIAGYEAVEFIGRYVSADHGPTVARIVGLFPPAGDRVLIFVSHTMDAQIPLTDLENLGQTFAGALIESTQILSSRSAAGHTTRY